jgi:hypothetical protein
MNSITKVLILLLIAVTGSSCAMFEHRDYYNEMELTAFEEPFFMPGRDFQAVPGDNGRAYRSESDIRRRTPATAKEKEYQGHVRSMKYELYSLENRVSDAEYHDYLKVRDEFNSDSERIYYLRLNGMRQKRDYLQARGIEVEGASWSDTPSYRNYSNNSNSNFYDRGRRPGNYQKAISVGMNQEKVLNSWGQPLRRDVSGNPAHGNERWTYQMGDRVKYIYFESGRVEGWTEQ